MKKFRNLFVLAGSGSNVLSMFTCCMYTYILIAVCRVLCGAGMARCNPGADPSRRCIPENWMCNGRDDCLDNSDENYYICGQSVE